MTVLGPQIDTLERVQPREVIGAVHAVRGLSILVDGLALPVGAVVRVAGMVPAVRGEIVGFDGPHAVVMLFDHGDGLAPGARVVGEQSAPTVQVGRSLLGRVIDGRGRPIDDGPPLFDTVPRAVNVAPTSPLVRRGIGEPLVTGIRSIDAMTTLGKGQRVGIFSGPGVGKSTLLSCIARNTSADVNVIALVGERGREVREFVERALGPEGLLRSVVVVATSDESPLLRVRAASVACAIAEHFRDAGADVMLMMDSLTRFAQAQRQIGLTMGEPPATKGYTPSVFALLPRLLERAGTLSGGGSITGLFAVLVEGDDLTEPIADAARGLLDGHIALSRTLAARGHYPAVDLLESISRVADDVCNDAHIAARRRLIELLAAYADAEELINIGAYARGSNLECDVAIAMKSDLDAFLRQPAAESAPYPETCKRLLELAVQSQTLAKRLAAQHVG